MGKFLSIIFCLMVAGVLLAQASSKALKTKIIAGCPDWMAQAIEKDLAPYRQVLPSEKLMKRMYQKHSASSWFVKFSIQNNQLDVDSLIPNQQLVVITPRIDSFKTAIKKLCRVVKMPDVTFLLLIHDGNDSGIEERCQEHVPFFTMSRLVGSKRIRVPDFESLDETYQIVPGVDITSYAVPWSEKIPALTWRGSNSQRSYDHTAVLMQPDNLHLFSRVRLCELSNQFPDLIDAKMTIGPVFPELQPYIGSWISYQTHLSYKYQMLIDGNASSYSKSGWRFFSNSVVFVPESRWEQWYYDALVPYVHYIPVKMNLDDLVEKILWAQEHDAEAQEIAKNAMNFARERLTTDDSLAYLYFLLVAYSQLKFTD